MLKRTIIITAIVLAVIFAFLMFFSLSYGQSLRRSGVMLARSVLKQAQHQFVQTGRVEPNGSWKPFIFTNQITVDGVTYQCSVATPIVRFDEEGVLAMTTNEIFIWVDKKRPPKIIPVSGYRPRYFPESF